MHIKTLFQFPRLFKSADPDCKSSLLSSSNDIDLVTIVSFISSIEYIPSSLNHSDGIKCCFHSAATQEH